MKFREKIIWKYLIGSVIEIISCVTGAVTTFDLSKKNF